MNIQITIANDTGITPTEGTILCLVCTGDSRKTIAKKLNRSPSTINRHIESLYQKLEVNNTQRLTLTAIAKGIIGLTITNLLSRFYTN